MPRQKRDSALARVSPEKSGIVVKLRDGLNSTLREKRSREDNKMNDSIDDRTPTQMPLRLLMAEMEITLAAPTPSDDLRKWIGKTRAGFGAMWPALRDEMERTRAGVFQWLLVKDGALSPQIEELRGINGELEGGFNRFNAALGVCENGLPGEGPADTGVLKNIGALRRRGLRLLKRFHLQEALIARRMTEVVNRERGLGG